MHTKLNSKWTKKKYQFNEQKMQENIIVTAMGKKKHFLQNLNNTNHLPNNYKWTIKKT